MKTLIAAKPEGGIESMQMINRTVYRALFLVMMLGLRPLTFGMAICAYFTMVGLVKVWVMCGGITYVSSVFMVTMFGNVPMNNRLDGMNPLSEDTLSYWKLYGRIWANWNHVRTLGYVVTSICFLAASVVIT